MPRSGIPGLPWIVVLACLPLLVTCGESGEGGDADTDVDVDTDADTDADTDTYPDWENLNFQNCEAPFNPWAAPERKLLSAPYLVNPKGDGVTLLWETFENEPSFVMWGPGETFTTVTCTTGETAPFDSDDFEDSHESFLHKAVLAGLEPGMRYSYTRPNAQVAVQDYEDVWYIGLVELKDMIAHPEEYDNHHYEVEWEGLGTWSFSTAPEPDEPFSLYVVGDNQSFSQYEIMVANSMEKFPADFYLHLGDIVQDGLFTEYPLNYLWMYRRVLAQTPSIHVSGNHEGDGRIIPYDSLFDIPAGEPVDINGTPTSAGPRTFTWDYGPIRMFMLDTQQDLGKDSVQYKWLDKELEKAVKSAPHIRYLFPVWHRPLFTWKPGRLEAHIQDIHELMKKWRVDAVWTGHTHWYERFLQDDVVYVVSGGGGAGLDTERPEDIENTGFNRLAAKKAWHFLVGEGDKNQIDFRTIESDLDFDTKEVVDVEIDSFTILAKDRSDLR